MTSSFVEALKGIVGHFGPTMKRNGFKKRRNTFNRTEQDQLVHVVSFCSLPAYSIGHGSFHLEFGVYVPAARIYTGNPDPRSWVSAPYCSMRAKIGPQSQFNFHHSWPIDDCSKVLMEVSAAIERGLAFLSLLRSHEDILCFDESELDRFCQFGSDFGLGDRLEILRTCIQLQTNQRLEAQETLIDYLNTCTSEEPRIIHHVTHVRKWAKTVNLKTQR
ncbi:MAG: DUF4304 domain-containing protein [Pseudomonadota bacterium]